MTNPAQLKMIHTLRRQVEGMDDDAYRGLLQTKYRVVSSKDLTDDQAKTLIDDLKRRGGRSAAQTATGKYAPILKALWLTGWNLGIVWSKDDTALMKFVERQTKISHTRFLTDPDAAKRAIEALKKWLARDGGVVWPSGGLDGVEIKKEVIRAIGTKMIAVGAFQPYMRDGIFRFSDFENYGYGNQRDRLPASFFRYELADYDRLAALMGARLRATLAKQAAAKRDV